MGLPARTKEEVTELRPYPVPRLQTLVKESSRDLFRLALRLCGDRDEAEDILQATWVNAFEALSRGAFRGDCKLETWLYRIVMHTVFDARRSEQRRNRLAESAARGEQAPQVSEAAVQLRELRAALAALPEDQRAAIALKELHGLTGREVAEVLERSEGAVEQLLVRARAALRERFES